MTIAFTSVKKPFGWLGNMAPFPIEFEGQTWRTTEALFQALRFSDLEIREKIRAEKSPMSAKMIAKSLRSQMTIEPMSEADLNNMRTVLQLKVIQHPELLEQLRATGNQRIIEDVTKRPQGSGKFWGAALEDQIWEGENWLGVLWEEVRAQE